MNKVSKKSNLQKPSLETITTAASDMQSEVSQQSNTETVEKQRVFIPLSVNIVTQAKDAEYLPALLETIPNGCEIVLLVTECSDDKKGVEFNGTMEYNDSIIQQYTWYYKLFDFSQARNIALKHSTRDWVMWLDTDDRLLLSDAKYYQELSEVPTGVGGFVCGCVGYTAPYLDNHGGTGCTPQVRIFRRHEKIKWTGIVHEQIIGSIEKEQLQIKSSPILIQHVGYEQDVHVMYAKLNRNVELLIRQLAVYPEQDARYYQESLINSLIELHKLQDKLL